MPPKSANPAARTLADMWGKKKQKPSEESKEDHAPASSHDDEAVPSFKTKKRRILESDDEDDPLAKSERASSVAPSSSPGPSRASSASPPPRPRKTRKVESNSAGPSKEAPPSDPEEQENENVSEDEEMDVDDGVASKIADAALSRVKDVDIKGGWTVGSAVPYAALAKTFALIEGTSKRLEKNSILTAFLLLVIQRSAKMDAKSLLQTVYLCINRLSPDYVGIELGIGESLLVKAIGESTGRSIATIKADLKKEGDLGLVAMNSKNSQKTLFKPKPLTVPFVFSNLKEIATTSGHSSQTKKVSIITKLLAACQDFEAKYIVRSLEGKLRIGNAEKSVLVAIAHAAVLAENDKRQKKWSGEKLGARLEEASNTIKSVYSELPSYDEVIPALLEHGIDGLRSNCKLRPGVPLKPMLAKPTKAIGEVLDRFENKKFTCEYKYDGERAQVHKLEDGTVAVFSRNSEDMSKKYPDLVDQLPKFIKESTKSFVLDAEAVAIDHTTMKLMPFQELSKRKRKDVKVEDIQVRVCLFAFDLLYLNGKLLSFLASSSNCVLYEGDTCSGSAVPIFSSVQDLRAFPHTGSFICRSNGAAAIEGITFPFVTTTAAPTPTPTPTTHAPTATATSVLSTPSGSK
ncbi:hypothetical protein ONZ45_g12047 [Pleurotus djamor]|nr:hypothetical protein ONZ45_g12047 [Pleurotus djamor]